MRPRSRLASSQVRPPEARSRSRSKLRATASWAGAVTRISGLVTMPSSMSRRAAVERGRRLCRWTASTRRSAAPLPRRTASVLKP